ncbi:hypothetical protein Ndes2526B_g07568 [Nannochloris sp. 'desiccata']
MFQCHKGKALQITTRALSSINPAGVDTSADKVSLVQGASRGLGLEFVRQLLARPGSVIATCRNPSAATDLQLLKDHHQHRLHVVQLDTGNEASIHAAAEQVSEVHSHINLLLNVSGVLHIPGVMSPETALNRVTMENLERVFRVNTFGPILVCKAFAPLLINAGKTATDEHPAVIANLSARVGSIGDNRLGGWYSYRASKTALNQLTKTMSLELARKNQKVAAIVLHPGTVATDLSAPFQRNVAPEKLFTKERAIKQLLEVVDRVQMKDTGSYVAWDGTPVVW